MSDVTLGSTPAGLTMWLIDAAPFTASVTASEAFPGAPDLLFGDGTTWSATLSADALTATWVRTAEDVAELLLTKPRRVTLRDPSTHHVWAHGTVYVTRVNPGDGHSGTLPPSGSITVDRLDGATHITYTIEAGPSAYDLAVADGFEGTEAEWLASLHGTNGLLALTPTATPGVLQIGA